jgi:rRNA maturation endonuclease Nob1
MPEYRCENCSAVFSGWGVGEICKNCGGKLMPANETAKIREIGKEKKLK